MINRDTNQQIIKTRNAKHSITETLACFRRKLLRNRHFSVHLKAFTEPRFHTFKNTTRI